MAEELKGATYQVDLTTEGAVLHADPNTVRTVLDHLRTCHNLTSKTLTSGGPCAPAGELGV
jgi:hypothetical protein